MPRGPAAWLALLVALPMPALQTACDACAGIAACVEPRVLAEGLVLDGDTKKPVQGVVVSYRFRFGPGLGIETNPSQFEDSTDAEGHYRFSATADQAGRLVGELLFTPPKDPVFTPPGERYFSATIDGVVVLVSSVDQVQAFSTVFLQRRPFIRARGRVVDGRTGGGIRDVRVRYRIVLGPMPADGGDSLVVLTDEEGSYTLFSFMKVFGSTVGTLAFLLPPPSPTRTFERVVFNTSSTDEFIEQIDTVQMVAPGFVRAEGRIVDVATGAGIADVRVSYRPRAGPPLVPEQPTGSSDSDGRFRLEARAGSVGGLVGTLTVEAPAPFGTREIPEVAIPAFRDPGATFTIPQIALTAGG